MDWLIVPIVTVLGMMGGQFLKVIRRVALPLVSIGFGVKNKKKRVYFLVLLGVVLSMGYGEDSRLMKLCGGKEWIVRMVYGLLVGAVVASAGFVYAIIIMPVVWLVHIPYSFKIGKYDWLWEDFVRYSALGLCIWRVIA